jgi:hypothetical protein
MNAETAAVVADLHQVLAQRGQLVKGFRDGDRVAVEYGGVRATGTVSLAGASGVKIGEVPVTLDGTGQTVRVPESIVTKEGA